MGSRLTDHRNNRPRAALVIDPIDPMVFEPKRNWFWTEPIPDF